MRPCIIAESTYQRLAARPIDHGLPPSLADPLGRPAMRLTIDEQWVDDSTAVVDRDVAEQCHLPRLGIDFDDGHVCAVVEREVFGVEEIRLIETGRHAEGQVVAEMRFAGD